jgi:H+/Cl- antiporter ClcA
MRRSFGKNSDDIALKNIHRGGVKAPTAATFVSELNTKADVRVSEEVKQNNWADEIGDGFELDYSIARDWREKHATEIQGPLAHMSEEEAKVMSSFEGLDYDAAISDIRIGATLRARKKQKTLADRFLAPKWILTALIGMSTGAVGFIVDLCCEKLSAVRIDTVRSFFSQGETNVGYLVWLAISATLALASTLLVNYGEPVAAGSGIPEVKGYLNGSNYMRFLSLKTAIIKVFGIICSVSAGFVIGKEGPLIHIGSAIGANFATLPGLWRLKWFSGELWTLRFRNDRDKRDFVSSGAAAGVATAFGSPTGGLCFALEEASTFWQLSLTWRTYFCTALATSVLWLLQSWYSGGDNYYPLMKYGQPGNKFPMLKIWEMCFIWVPALLGGLVGASFCELNKHISEWRKKYILGRKKRQVLQVMLIIFINVTVLAFLPQIFDKCLVNVPNYQCGGYENKYYCGGYTPVDTVGAPGCEYTCTDFSHIAQYTCPDTNEKGQTLYSSTGTLSLQTWDDVVFSLFHNDSEFNKVSLTLFFMVMYLLANFTYGIAVPSGLFVPCILMGATLGRLQGEIMRSIDPAANVTPGVWAMLGAAGMLAGVTRITITITVILFETTGEWGLILPTMMIVIMAKSLADQFNISLYDMHVELKCIPFVEPEPPLHVEGLNAGDVMSKGCVSCTMIASVHDLVNMLAGCRHNGFPCLADNGKIRGLILRNQIITILKYYQPDDYVTRDQIEAHTPDPEEDWKFLLPCEAFAVSLQSKNMSVADIKHLLDTVPAEAAVDLRPYVFCLFYVLPPFLFLK